MYIIAHLTVQQFMNVLPYALCIWNNPICRWNEFFINHGVSVKSKKISNDQELIQSNPTSCPQNQKKITKYKNWQQFTKCTRGEQHEQLFPRQVVIQLPKIY